jgi:hypothetical protein
VHNTVATSNELSYHTHANRHSMPRSNHKLVPRETMTKITGGLRKHWRQDVEEDRYCIWLHAIPVTKSKM